MKNLIRTYPYNRLLTIASASVMLCFWAFYNTFPMTFNSDSAMYIEAAFNKIVEPDRPILYGLFIYYTSLQWSLWLVVLVQAFIVSLVIFYYFRYFTPVRNFAPYYLSFIAVVTFVMGGSFDVSWLMADVFTPVSLLCTGLLLFAGNLKTRDSVVISVLAVLGIAMHNSHFYIFLCLGLLLLAGFGIKAIREKYRMAGIKARRVMYIIALTMISNFFLSSVQYMLCGSFTSSRGGIIFLMGNLVEMGVVDTYLAENCELKHYTICQYKDTLPNNFMWASNSPMRKTGGWEGSKDEYTAIIKGILTTPKYLKTVVFKSILLGFKQFFYFDTGEAGMPTERVDMAINMYFPHEYSRFRQGWQCLGTLNFGWVNYIQTLIVGACLFCFLLVFLYHKLTIRYRMLILVILAGLIINAWVCGTFSGVYPRYQARLTWLMPLPLFLYAVEWMGMRELKIKNERMGVLPKKRRRWLGNLRFCSLVTRLSSFLNEYSPRFIQKLVTFDRKK
jgi:hypothetical protein